MMKKYSLIVFMLINITSCVLWRDRMIIQPQAGVYGVSLTQIIQDIDNDLLDQKIKFYNQKKFKKKKITSQLIKKDNHFFIIKKCKITKELLNLISEDF